MSGRDPTRRFSDRVADYVRYRPRYPPEVVGVLEEEIGLRPSWVVADVGSGTGFSAEPFVANGNTVFAVEPNADMRRAAEDLLGHEPGFRSVDGRAEATGLDVGSVDLVVAGQAFHWFDPAAAREEFLRILRPPAPVALVWNTRLTDASPFLRDYEALLEAYGTDYASVRHDRIDAAALAAFFRGDFLRRSLPNAQVLDLPALQGRLLSSSYTPGPEDPRRAPMIARLEEIFRAHQVDGRVRMDYETEVWVGRLAATAPPPAPARC